MSAQVTNSFQNTVHTCMLTYSDWCRGWKCTENTDWIGLSSVLRPRQHSIKLYGRRFLQVKRPNQLYQSTEGTNSTQTVKRERVVNAFHTPRRLALTVHRHW